MRYSKVKAVVEMIEGAMAAVDDDRAACAITLACAAEEAMPPTSAPTFFTVARDAFAGIGGSRGDQSRAAALINAERNWLKHHDESQPAEMDLSNAILAVVRALSRFDAVYGRERRSAVMLAFTAAADDLDLE